MTKGTSNNQKAQVRNIAIWALLAALSAIMAAAMFLVGFACLLLMNWLCALLLRLLDASELSSRMDQAIRMAIFHPFTGAALATLFLLNATVLLLHLRRQYCADNNRPLLAKLFIGIEFLVTDIRARMVLLAIAVISLVSFGFCIALMGLWRHLPEILADWIGMIVGIMSTPFLLEASFIFIGFTIVMAINHFVQKRAGDDFVELEVKDAEE